MGQKSHLMLDLQNRIGNKSCSNIAEIFESCLGGSFLVPQGAEAKKRRSRVLKMYFFATSYSLRQRSRGNPVFTRGVREKLSNLPKVEDRFAPGKVVRGEGEGGEEEET